MNHLDQKLRMGFRIIQHLHAGIHGSFLSGAVISNVRQCKPKGLQLMRKFFDFCAGRCYLKNLVHFVRTIRKLFSKGAAVILRGWQIQREKGFMPLFFSGIINQPVSNSSGSQRKECSLFCPIRENGFIEGKHGNIQFILVFIRRAFQKASSF